MPLLRPHTCVPAIPSNGFPSFFTPIIPRLANDQHRNDQYKNIRIQNFFRIVKVFPPPERLQPMIASNKLLYCRYAYSLQKRRIPARILRPKIPWARPDVSCHHRDVPAKLQQITVVLRAAAHRPASASRKTDSWHSAVWAPVVVSSG